MTTGATLLQARHIRKSFGGVEVLHGVDLHVDRAEVLALLGENGAGKSTLVKIIAGDYSPDDGEIIVGEHRVNALDPVRSRALGIRMIFQELSDAGSLTVAENICLGRWPNRAGRVSWSAMRSQARAALAELDADIDVRRPVESLRVGERQLVEIARALADAAQILILDEPTAALSGTEVDRLFGAINRLRDRGVGMVYITHRLDEVGRIADRVQVLRDGVSPINRPVVEVTRAQMVTAMIGRSAQTVQRPEAVTTAGEPTLSVSGLGSGRLFAAVNLTVGRGEVVVLYGKVGSGTAEVAETLYGLHPVDKGELVLFGRSYRPSSPAASVNAGVGFLPADRQRAGNFSVRPLTENLAAPSWHRMAVAGVVRRRTERAAFRRWQDTLGIKAPRDLQQPIALLSGGNQQKVLLARWFERGAGLLVLVEPTRGVDVGAREDIYRTLRAQARERGIGVLIATSDYEEVVQLADRALVMSRGRIVEELAGQDVTTPALIAAAGG